MSKDPLIVIAGPTASGKSKTAVEVAKSIRGEIISADSMQIYKGMDIGSAKVTREEARGVRHHLIDVLDVGTSFSVAEYKEMALKAAEGIYERGNVPVVCGGTGFYIQALLYDIDFKDEPDGGDLRAELRRVLDTDGPGRLLEILSSEDPYAFSLIDHGNIKRVMRAIEFHRLHGESIVEHNRAEEEKKKDSPFDYKYFVLTMDREILYRRINARVDRMMEAGLLEEAVRLRASGLKKDSTAAFGIGYRELYRYLDGEISLSDAVEKIKTDTRHYAKRQLTWFKREKNAIWIDVLKEDPADAVIRRL